MGSPGNKIKIGIVAGEASGDQLGASLMDNLVSLNPHIEFIGVGGSLMEERGLSSFFDMKKISVMGLIEPLLNLKELLSLRRKLKEFFIKEEIDLFIGIDSPDFNLPISRYLKRNNIKTIQYVGPSIWAWRQGRIRTIEKSVDKVLTLFPFESKAYEGSSVRVDFVGHPLAHSIKEINKYDKRSNKKIVFMPGSRKSEILNHGRVFLETARKLKDEYKGYQFHMPLTDESHIELIEGLNEEKWIEVTLGNAKEVLREASLGFVTSGTASLEASLSGTPVVVAYRTNWFSYMIIKPLLKVDNISLPNLLAKKEVLPEVIQGDVSSKNLYLAFKRMEENYLNCLGEFKDIHKSLLGDKGAKTASYSVLETLHDE